MSVSEKGRPSNRRAGCCAIQTMGNKESEASFSENTDCRCTKLNCMRAPTTMVLNRVRTRNSA